MASRLVDRVVQEAVFDLREVARLARRVGDVAHVAARLFAALRQQARPALGQACLPALPGWPVRAGSARASAPHRRPPAPPRAPVAATRPAPRGTGAPARPPTSTARHPRFAGSATARHRPRHSRQRGRHAIRPGWRVRPCACSRRHALAHGLALAFGGDEFLQHLRRRADALHHLRADDRARHTVPPGPAARSADGRPGCRCRPSRCTSAAAPSGSACRTSYRSGPGSVPARPCCARWRGCARSTGRSVM